MFGLLRLDSAEFGRPFRRNCGRDKRSSASEMPWPVETLPIDASGTSIFIRSVEVRTIVAIFEFGALGDNVFAEIGDAFRDITADRCVDRPCHADDFAA